MARQKAALAIIFSPNARKEIKGIYAYNVEHRSTAQANKYEDFLLSGIARLATEYAEGKDFSGFPTLKGITLNAYASGGWPCNRL